MTDKPGFDFTPVSDVASVAENEAPSLYNDPALASVDPADIDEAINLATALQERASGESPKGTPGTGATFEGGPEPAFPSAPGTDGRDEKHPFGYLDPDDPDHDEMMRELKPSTLLNMVCLAGCRHYCEVIDEEPTADPQEWKAVHRMCKCFQDDEGDWDITERTMYACSQFAPKWYDPIGQVRRVLNWIELNHASGVVNAGIIKLRPSVVLGTVASNALKRLGVDIQRKLDIESSDEEEESDA